MEKVKLPESFPRSKTEFVRRYRELKDTAPPLPSLQSGWHTFSPELGGDAHALFGSNAMNRELTLPTVARYALRMLNGQWRATGQSICVSADGELNEGQHRLLACLLGGVAFKTYLVTDVVNEHNMFAYYDIGKVRTAPQIIKAAGLNGLARWIQKVIMLDFADIMPTSIRRQPLTNADFLEYISENPELREVVGRVASDYAEAVALFPLPEHAYFLAWKVYGVHGHEAYENFFDDLVNASLGEGSLGLLRSELKKFDSERGRKGGAFTAAYLTKTFVAFNAWFTGQELKRLKAGATFPKIAQHTSMAAE